MNPDGRSSSRFEQVWIGGEQFILKHIHRDDDFIMRVADDFACRGIQAWDWGLRRGA